jgi:amino acid transporter
MASPAVPVTEGSKGLKTGALGLVSVIVIGVASTAPGYSLAASLGFVSDEVGLKAPAIMWLAFVPMAFIAAAYYYLNRADPDCGTTFTWVTRAMGPKSGWMGGWGIFMADLIIMPSLAQISAIYLFLLFGADGLAASTFWTTVVGIIFILAMTWICYTGIELSARSQVILLGTELGVLVVFSVVALVRVYADAFPDSVKPSLSWLSPFGIPVAALTSGILISVFIYWGWDTAVTVNEESQDANRIPGLAAVLSTVILLLIYVITTFAAQAVHGAGFLADNADDVLSATGKDVLGGVFDKFLIIAVLTSAAASCQTTILPSARTMLSMGAYKAAPEKFARIHPRHLTPDYSTWFFGLVSCAWYLVLVVAGGDVLADSIVGVGLMIAFYYGITGYACVAYYWSHLFTSLKNFVFVGLLPLLGALMLTWVFVKSLIDLANPENSESGASWFGLGPPFVIGGVLLLMGIPLMYLWKAAHPEFFRVKRDPADVRPPPEGGEPLPPLLQSASAKTEATTESETGAADDDR